MHVRGEEADDHAALGGRDEILERLTDPELAAGLALGQRVRRVRQDERDPAREERLDRLAREAIARRRRVVDLEVAGVDDDALGRLDHEPVAGGHRVGDLPRPEGHPGELDAALGGEHAVVDVAGAVPRVLRDPVLDEGQRVRGAVHRDVEVSEEVADGADVILVAVREHERDHVTLSIDQPLPVGVHHVDAEPPPVEDHAAVEHDDPPVVLDRHAVHADLAEPPERYEANTRHDLEPTHSLRGASRRGAAP